MADPITTKIGDVSAYLDAVAHGFEGTRAEFGELLANSANYAQSAGSAASAASAAAATATTKAGEAAAAATAAQTAKIQTEQSASQALTDIAAARSGTISAVQTEGVTQTANATAQALAAATSATTASTKASEASASATTATTKATEAAASATSAAQSASNAQNVLDSIPADYSDLSTNVSQLQADLDDLDDNVNSRLEGCEHGIDIHVTREKAENGKTWGNTTIPCFFFIGQTFTITNNGSNYVNFNFRNKENTQNIQYVQVNSGQTKTVTLNVLPYKLYAYADTYPIDVSISTQPYPEYVDAKISAGVDPLTGEVDALTGEVVFPPTFKIDLSSYDTVKLYGTDRLYTHSKAYGRRAILFSDVADNINGATFNSTTNVLTIPMSAESTLLLNPLTNVISLSTATPSPDWVIPNNNIVLLYRYYQSYGGLLFNTSFTRQFNDKVEEVLATHNLGIIDKYAEQIGNVVSGADYSRGSYNKNLTFLLVSDSHEDYEAIGNAIELSENINAIDCILHLGDSSAIPAIPISGLNPVASYIAGKTLTKPFFAVMGNHDGQNNGDSSTYGTVEQGVAGFLATLNTSSMYDERGYGYYDFTDESIRLIILNCFDYPATTTEGTYDFYDDYILWQQDQVDFFINALKSVPSGYTVIVASHYSELANIDNTIIPQHSGSGKITGTYMVIGDKTRMSDVVMSDIINAYKQRTTLNKSYTFSNGSVTGNVSVNDSFATANGEFAIWVCGHKHRSSVSKSSVGDYWVYVHDTSCCGQSGWATAYSNQPRCQDTNTRDLITAMSIDTSNKVINFTRIGAHINRFLDDENFVHLSYATEST